MENLVSEYPKVSHFLRVFWNSSREDHIELQFMKTGIRSAFATWYLWKHCRFEHWQVQVMFQLHEFGSLFNVCFGDFCWSVFVLSTCVCSFGDPRKESNSSGEKRRWQKLQFCISALSVLFLKAVKVLGKQDDVVADSSLFCSSSQVLKEILQLWENRASEFFFLWQMASCEGYCLKLRYF